jgi:hypothetical protein
MVDIDLWIMQLWRACVAVALLLALLAAQAQGAAGAYECVWSVGYWLM